MKRKMFELMRDLLMYKECGAGSNIDEMIDKAIQVYCEISGLEEEVVREDIDWCRSVLPLNDPSAANYENTIKAYGIMLELINKK